jgi:hypothetical protein
LAHTNQRNAHDAAFTQLGLGNWHRKSSAPRLDERRSNHGTGFEAAGSALEAGSLRLQDMFPRCLFGPVRIVFFNCSNNSLTFFVGIALSVR